MTALDAQVHARLLAEQGQPATDPDRLAELVRRADPLLGAAAVAEVVAGVEARLVGLGPLDPLLADPAVTDVLVNGPGEVWVERRGVVVPSGIRLDEAEVALVVERIVGPLGRRADPGSPVVDGRLPDGSRVHIVVPPLAIDGPCVTIRRFSVRPIELDDVAGPEVAALLRWAVRARANVVVSGATGSGKTTLLNALGREVPDGERIITVEDAAELRLRSEHVVRLEARPASADGLGAIDCRELVRNALRMRPDRLVVGEVRGVEALDMVQAMNTGHDGSLSTVHANSAEDALRRLEALVLLAGIGLPLEAVRDHLAAAVDLVVHVVRGADGRRFVAEVAEVRPPGGRAAGRAGVAQADDVTLDRTIGRTATVLVADASGVVQKPRRGLRHVAAGPFVVPRPTRSQGVVRRTAA